MIQTKWFVQPFILTCRAISATHDCNAGIIWLKVILVIQIVKLLGGILSNKYSSLLPDPRYKQDWLRTVLRLL
jgi:hypothetical protein